MMDWKKATDELSKPLDHKHVKGRSQGGVNVSYIEGWHAIAEMNRIFGFGEWDRETLEIRQLGEPREVNGKIRVDYMARVRVTVGGRVREGAGFGQGIDKDIGQAHESGLKEAETDAMKRAMMTLGNPFGLALYDKTKANVSAPEPDQGEIRDRLKSAIKGTKTRQQLTALWGHKATVSAIGGLPDPMRLEVEAVHKEQLQRMPVDPSMRAAE